MTDSLYNPCPRIWTSTAPPNCFSRGSFHLHRIHYKQINTHNPIPTREVEVKMAPENKETLIEYKFKVVVVGDSKVGKHTLLDKAAMEVLENRMVERMGVTIGTYNVQAIGHSNKAIYANIMLWGVTAKLKGGKFRDKVESGIQGIIVMADASRPDTVLNTKKWIERMQENHDLDTLDLILVLNKVDLVNEKQLLIGQQTMTDYAQEFNAQLLLTSCETGSNLKLPFREIARKMCERLLS
jgi:GTPase SAR1 family protein